MAEENQSDVYRGFIACLNRQDWATLEHFVANDLKYNDKQIRLSGYRKLLTRFRDEIPDVYFELAKLVSQPLFSRAGWFLTARHGAHSLDCPCAESASRLRECHLRSRMTGSARYGRYSTRPLLKRSCDVPAVDHDVASLVSVLSKRADRGTAHRHFP